ncbi:hypothetical protein [Deinococcus pimensis]|uniref:hypothetical protein n=1 Tax=Deinococcus pimensis TaxID=309888 RepID=UPI000481DE52|nr:hypothetical protein [Deinococcus pimensis]
MEGGLITLIVGAMLLVLFTDAAPSHLKNRAALHAIAASAGLGLFVSGYVRDAAALMSVGLGFGAVGLLFLALPRAASKTN